MLVTKGFSAEALEAFAVTSLSGMVLSAGNIIASVGILYGRAWAMWLVYMVYSLSFLWALILFGVFGNNIAMQWLLQLYAAIAIFLAERVRHYFGLSADVEARYTTKQFMRHGAIILFIICIVLDPTLAGHNKQTLFKTLFMFYWDPLDEVSGNRFALVINQYTLGCLLLFIISYFLSYFLGGSKGRKKHQQESSGATPFIKDT